MLFMKYGLKYGKLILLCKPNIKFSSNLGSILPDLYLSIKRFDNFFLPILGKYQKWLSNFFDIDP
jgi:hypothetical protein